MLHQKLTIVLSLLPASHFPVYLRTSPEICMERMKARSRSEEKTIPMVGGSVLCIPVNYRKEKLRFCISPETPTISPGLLQQVSWNLHPSLVNLYMYLKVHVVFFFVWCSLIRKLDVHAMSHSCQSFHRPTVAFQDLQVSLKISYNIHYFL